MRVEEKNTGFCVRLLPFCHGGINIMNLRLLCSVLFSLALLFGCAEPATEEVEDKPAAGNAKPETVETPAPRVTNEAPVDVGEAYLYINSQKPGVQVTESGLQFEILESGDGATPTLASVVTVHYHGTLTDGTVFDSSVDRGEPATFSVNRLIRGWTEALQMMKEGDRWRLVVPPDLGYGERGAGGRIPPNATLVFEVELIEVKSAI